jgi:aspartate/methionine/tyrosine aminotransferase
MFLVLWLFLGLSGITRGYLSPSIGKNTLPRYSGPPWLHSSNSKEEGGGGPIELSPLINAVSVSKTIEIHALTKDMERAGEKVFSLCVGEPDYQPPAEVMAAIKEAVERGETKYTDVAGTVELREAIAEDLKKRKGVVYTADQIVVAGGAKQAIMQALLCVVKPGDAVIIPRPYWTSYPDMVKICQATPTLVETRAEDGYAVRAESIRAALAADPRASCIVLCNPNNPTGCVMTGGELQRAVADVLVDYPHITVISDEIYEHLVYGGAPHVSFAALPGMSERTITVNGFSKSHSMTGLRVGYAAAPLHVAKACGKLQSQLTSCASSIGQYAALRALTSTPPAWIPTRVRELQGKRDLMYSLLSEIPGGLLSCPKPRGAFYMLPDVSGYYGCTTATGRRVDNATDFCLELLREHGVALVPGEAFGAERCVRLSYAASEELIRESIGRLSQFVTSLQRDDPN